jgi:hypothetical protein
MTPEQKSNLARFLDRRVLDLSGRETEFVWLIRAVTYEFAKHPGERKELGQYLAKLEEKKKGLKVTVRSDGAMCMLLKKFQKSSGAFASQHTSARDLLLSIAMIVYEDSQE